jgi:hypothetical protein
VQMESLTDQELDDLQKEGSSWNRVGEKCGF